MSDLLWLLRRLDFLSLVDILIVASIIYWLLFLIRGTQAVQLVRGILTVVLLTVFIINVLHLTAFNWLARNGLPALLVAIPVIFQPEIRRGLERLGRTEWLFGRSSDTAWKTNIIEQISVASRELAEKRHGALMVLEQETGLEDVVETGIRLDAELTSELLLSIFFPGSPLHDQAVIVRGGRVVAARCLLPLAEEWPPERQLGTRHRAAVGVTERSDALVVVISEETGTVSLAHNGRLIRRVGEARLSRMLHALYDPPSNERFPQWLPQRRVD